MIYKRRWLFYLIVVTFILGALEYIIFMNKDGFEEVENTEVLHFSHESGFYEEDILLEITSNKKGTIYYTLDGTVPDKNSMVYEAPIHISDASLNENVYSMRTDVSTGFREDLIAEYSGEKYFGYKAPEYNVDKATIVRAVLYYDDVNYSDIITGSYFVDFGNKKGYDNMNIVSIVTDPNNLFGYERGIYVTGQTFDEYWATKPELEHAWKANNWIWWPANYRKLGSGWEKEAYCQFYDEERKLFLSQKCGIRIHGGMSRGLSPKSLNLYARKEYDSNSTFQSTFFDNDYYPSRLTLSQGGNDYRCKMKDYVFSELIEDLNVATMDHKPYVMFLDGEYWGVYWLTEKYDADYVSYHYGVYDKNVVMVKNGLIEEGNEDDFETYQDMLKTCVTLDVTLDENYKKVCELIDIESYIDYHAAMLYAARSGDWPSSNYALWRTREKEKNPYGDGKWRWMVFDMNSSGMTADLVDLDAAIELIKQDEMFANLMTNDEFRLALLDRIEELGDTVFDVNKVNQKIDEYLAIMEVPLKYDAKRFFGDTLQEEFDDGVESVRTFFENREESLKDILIKY